MDGAVTILPLTYLGNIEYFAALCSGGRVVIDLGENYVKQTYRNRCEILTSGGVTPLTVNVVKGRSMRKQAVKNMRVDYSKRWQHQHRTSLVSAYGNSPYFEHYWERLSPFFEKEYAFLADLNRGLLETVLACLKITPDILYSEEYVTAGAGDNDLRGSFAPLERDSSTGVITTGGHGFATKPYYQVFSEKFPFSPNLSIIDLLFCEGPQTGEWLSKGISELSL